MKEQKQEGKPISYEAVPQDENASGQPDRLCSVTTTRRSFRILVLVALLFIAIGLPAIYVRLQYTLEKYNLAINKGLKFILKDCKVYITEDSSRDAGIYYLTVDVPGSGLSKKETSVYEIEAKSSTSYTDSCVADLIINPNAVIPGLEILCEGTCYVSHMGPSALNLGSGILTITGGRVDFTSIKLKASSTYIDIQKGNIHIYSLTLTSQTANNIMRTGEGDIVVQSTDNMRISWWNTKNNLCAAAPVITSIGTNVPNCQVSVNFDSNPSSCSNSYMLCKAGSSCSASTSAPTLTLSTSVGGIYTNLIDADGAVASSAGSTVRGWSFTKGIEFDDNLNQTLNDYINGYNGTAKADPIIWFEIGSSKTFTTSAMTYLLVANNAYLNAYPWWISFFSADLLLGWIYRIEGNLAPGFCPFKTLPTTSDVQAVRNMLIARLTQLFTGRAEAAFVYSEDFPTISNLPQNNLGFRGTLGDTYLYNLAFDNGVYKFKEYGLAHALSLLLAVIISIILACIMGIIAFIGLVYALNHMVEIFTMVTMHLKNYTHRARTGTGKEEEVQSKLNVDKDKIADVSSKSKKGEDEEKSGSIISLSPFMLIDNLVDELKRVMTNSVDEFCESLFVPLKLNDVDDFQPMRVKIIRAEYEKTCFLKQMPEEDLMSDANKKKFELFGFTFEKPAPDKKGDEVEVLVKIRWKDKEIILEVPAKDNEEQGSDYSLSAFFKANCELTPFDADKIEFEDFKAKYAQFCEIKRLPICTISRAQLHDAFSVESTTDTPDYLVRLGNVTTFKVDLEKVKSVNEELMEMHSGMPKGKALKSFSSEAMAKARSLRSFLYDIIAVALHIICIGILAGILVILPLFVELEVSKYTLSDYRYNLKYEDFSYAFWNVPNKILKISPFSLACFIVAGVYIIAAIIELVVYYRYMSFPKQSFRDFMALQPSFATKVGRAIEWTYICFILSLVITYISLVIVWSILGAILNPNAYLAYGAAAATLMSFVAAKISEFKKLNDMGIQALQDMLFSKLQGFLEEIMKNLLLQAGFSTDTVSQVIKEPGGVLERAERLVRNSSVGKAMISMGIDPKDAVGMIQGDENSLIEIGVKQGVPKDVMKLLLAMIKGRKNEVIEQLVRFAAIPQLEIDPEIIRLAIDLITNNSELNVPVLITNLSKIFFDISFKNFLKIMAQNLDPDKVAYMDICKQIFPRLISAFRNFKPEEMDNFIEEYEKINEFLYDSVKKKAIALTTSQHKVFGKLFNEKGEPIFAFPSYVMKGVNIFKLITMSGQEKLKGQPRRRIMNAIIYIMENFFGADNKVTSMFNLLLAEGPEAIEDGNGGLATLETQDKVLTNMANLLKVPPSLLRIGWKMWSGNFTIDEKFVIEVAELIAGQGDLNYHMPNTDPIIKWYKLIMQFFNISNTRVSLNSIMSEAQKFSVESTLSTVVHLFGETKFNRETAELLLNSKVFRAVAQELHLPINEALGILALFKGDFSSNELIELFDSLKKRWGMPDFPSRAIIGVISLFLSKNENELITGCGILRLPYVELLLTAKKLLHPANIASEIFEKLGLRLDDLDIAKRKYIPLDDPTVWDEWLKNLKKLLTAEFRPVKAEVKKAEVAPPITGKSPEAKSDTSSKEEKKEPPKTAVPEDDSDEESNKLPEFSEIEKKIRAEAKLLISLTDIVINEDVVVALLSKLPVPREHIDMMAGILVVLLRALSDLRGIKPDNQIKSAINQISEVLNLEADPLNAINSLVHLRKKEDVIDAIDYLMRNLLSKHELEAFRGFCTFILDKEKVMQNIEQSVYNVAEKLNLPRFLVKYCVSTVTTGHGEGKLGMEEFLSLLDFAGFTEESFKEKKISFKWPNNKPVTITQLRFMLAGLVVGNSVLIRRLLSELGFPEPILNIAFSMAVGNRTVSLNALIEGLLPALEKFGLPKGTVYTLFEIYKYLDGHGKQRCLDKELAVTGYEYLKNKLGIVPEVLVCLEHAIKMQPDKLIEDIPILIKSLIDLDRLPEEMRVKPEIISGLLAILTGNNNSLEKLAEAMKVDPGLIEVCMKISSITRHGEYDIPKYLREFLQSPLLARVWNKLKINPEIMDALLTLTFRTYNIENPNRLLQKLNMIQHVDISFAQFLLATTNSYAELQSIRMPIMSQNSERRLATIEELKKYVTPVAKKFFIDPDIALIAMRIRQGDFFIIEDYANYLHPLLPTPNARKLAMGMCGVMTLPVSFSREFDDYPDTFEFNLTFESAVEMLCDLFKINPIVARIMMMDDKALNLCQERFGMNKKVLCWFIVTLINLPIFVLENVAFRECRKLLYLKELELTNMMKVLEEEERKKNPPPAQPAPADPNAPPVNPPPVDPNNPVNPPPPVPPADPNAPPAQPAQPGVPNAPPPAKVEEHKTQADAETKKILRMLKESLASKTKATSTQSYYDDINFDSDEYANIDEYQPQTLSAVNEVFETVLFNREIYSPVNYDYITAKERREGAFMVSDERVTELFGTKEEYSKAIAEAFFVDPKDPKIWPNKETLALNYSWVNKADRGIRKNVWEIFKKFMKQLSDSTKLTNGVKHRYQPVTLNHMVFFMLLLRMRRRMNSSYDLKRDYNFYALYASECEALDYMFEGLALSRDVLGPEFSRVRMFKILSFALNANIANTIDAKIFYSWHREPLYYQFKETYENKQELQKAIDYCATFLIKVKERKCYISSTFYCMNTFNIYLTQPNDILDAGVLGIDVTPYDYTQGSYYGGGQMKYDAPKDDPFIDYVGKAKIDRRRPFLVTSLEMEDAVNKKLEEDPISKRPLSEVEKFLKKIEIYLVIEQEKLDFLLDIALLQWDAFERISPVLTNIGYLKNENTTLVYKTLTGAASMRKSIHEWQVESLTKKAITAASTFTTDVLSTVFPFLGKMPDEALVQSIVLLAHGVIDQSTIKELAFEYGLDNDLVNAFFFSSFSNEVLGDEDRLSKFVEPLLKKLRIDSPERRKLIFAIVDIYLGKEEGWEAIAEFCCFKQKKNALMIFKCLLQLADWDGIEEAAEDIAAEGIDMPTMSVRKYFYKLRSKNSVARFVDDIPATMIEIIKFIKENEIGKQLPIDEEKLFSYINIIDGIIRRDLQKIIQGIRFVKEDLGLPDSGYIDLLQAFVFLTNKMPINGDEERMGLIMKATNVITNWLGDMLNIEMPEVSKDQIMEIKMKKEEYVKPIRALMSIALSIIHGNYDILGEGIKAFLPFVDKLTQVFTFMKQMKQKIFDEGIPINNFSLETLKAFIKCIDIVVYKTKQIWEFMEAGENNIRQKKKDLRTMNLSLVHYETYKNYFGKNVTYIKEFINYLQDKYDPNFKYEDLKIIMREATELEENPESLLPKAYEIIRNEGYYFANPIIQLIMIGDLPLLLKEIVKSASVLGGEVIGKLEVIFRLINMNEKTFKELVQDPKKMTEYQGSIQKALITPIIDYIKANLADKIAETSGEFEKAMLMKAKDLLSKPELLTQMIMLMHFIMYGAARKLSIAENVSSLYATIKDSLSTELKKFMPLIISALSGYNENRTSDIVSIAERRQSFLKCFIQMCIPDLEPKLPLIERLVKFGLLLIKLGTSPEQMKEAMPEIANEVGALIGLNADLLQGIFGIMKGDSGALINFVAPICKIDEKIVQTLQNVVAGANKLVSTVTKEEDKNGKALDDIQRSSWLTLMKKVTDGEAHLRELFELVDKSGDGSGGISVHEFSQLMLKLNMPMTEHRVNEIFARCKSKHSTKPPDELDITEFEEAVKYVQSKRIFEGLSLMGISKNQLILLFIILILILILLFAFIFLGIAAFSTGGTFGSLVNSMMPLGAGFAVGQKSPIDFKDAEWSKKLKEVADEVIHMIGG